mgnify:CR=1 FL=1|jgi:hypothetical protein
MDEFTKIRWDRDKDPSKHKPATAIQAALELNEEVGFTHVVVCYCYKAPGSDPNEFAIGFKQAGELETVFGPVGLVDHVKNLLSQ